MKGFNQDPHIVITQNFLLNCQTCFITVLLVDNAGAMQLLMQYPWSSDHIASTWDINDLIHLALHYRKPEVLCMWQNVALADV